MTALPETGNWARASPFRCRCGRPVFFRNSRCLACGTQLGYEPDSGRLLPLAGLGADEFVDIGSAGTSASLRRCANFMTPAACNWVIRSTEFARHDLCRCCRLNRAVPDLRSGDDARWWHTVELAKRRVIASLIGLGLPVRSRLSEDPELGLVFDVLRAAPGSPPVTTGHLDGVVTLDLEEADPARREGRRVCLDERYRTMPGHLRHEIGHYYWYRLLRDSAWMDEFRELFGDERLPYDDALHDHYRCGPPVDWQLHHVSAYASAHPWEDWAETWAHYLHMLDTSATAAAVGIDTTRTELLYEPFTAAVLEPVADRGPEELFLSFLNTWIALTVALNELSRSMGHPDFYPFVLSSTAVRKLHFVHRVVEAFAGRLAP